MARSKMHFLEGKKIIVAGGGIAGLSFVQAMHKLWDSDAEMPEIVIYERDSREGSASRYGASLSLHGVGKEDGMVTLQKLGLLDTIMASSVPGLSFFKLWDQNWKDLITVKPKPYKSLSVGGIRIARKDLRMILIEGAERAGATIHWGTKCTAARRLQSGRMLVTISHDAGHVVEEECDLLIAADGSGSKIRGSFRPDDVVKYNGAIQMGGISSFPDGIPSPVDKSWGMLISGQGVSSFFSAIDKDRVVWAISRLEPERMQGSKREMTPEECEELKAEAKEMGNMLAEPFQTLVDATDPKSGFIFPARDKQPFQHDASLQGVIFIGDANHAVSPFAGNGANLALSDGWDLAEQLCQTSSLDKAVAAYDKISYPRAVQTLKVSHQRINVAHLTGIKGTLFKTGMSAGGFLMWLVGVAR
jgi:2-polyprenyl-6-methoxyphenol hydroxylase-like FAD-dependent oxidoreductase